jgi:putative ABC transport system permease protein
MFILTIKGLWAHKVRYALTGVAVVLGVAFMAGTMVLTDTMQQTFDGVIASANDGTDVIVRRSAAIDGDFGEARDRVDAAVVDQVAGVEGVQGARGSIGGFAQLVHAGGKAADTEGMEMTLGANWIDDDRLNPFTLSAGNAPVAPDDVVVDLRTAEAEGWQIGDGITVMTKAGPAPLTISGTATYGAVKGLPGTSLVATTDETAQRLFGEPGRYDHIAVTAESGVSAGGLARRIAVVTGATEVGAEANGTAAPATGLEVLTGSQDTADQQADLRNDLGFFSDFLMAFAYVALFVGMFIIYNTFSIVVAQRLKDLALLRALGARRRQVLASVVLESVVVGVVASALGLVAGIGLSFGLRELLATVGLDIPQGDLVVASGTILTAMVVGVTMSVASAVFPAVRASRIAPIAALRDIAVDRSGVSVQRAVAGLLVTGAGIGAFAAGLQADGKQALTLVGLGAAVVVVGILVLGPVLVRPVIGLLGAPASRLSGVTGRYATENAQRSPKRTAATASALMIGVALVGFITILAASTKSSVSSAVDKSFRADFVVDSGSFDRGFGTGIEADLAAVPEVDSISPLRSAPAEVQGAATSVVAMDTGVLDRLYEIEVTAGSLADVHGDGIAVKDTTAADEGLALGDSVPIRFADGVAVDLVVRALVQGNVAGAGETSWLLDLDTFEAHVSDQFDRQVFVTVDDGVSAEAGRTAIESALAQWPNADVQDQAEFKQQITGDIDKMLNLIYGLLALAVVIALIGIANTLALSIHERTRELGLLRAVGMHRRQLRSAVRWESLLIAILGAALGAVLAVGGSWGVVSAMGSEGVTTLTLPWTQLTLIMTLAGAAGVVAATGPARRAAKFDILAAISSE